MIAFTPSEFFSSEVRELGELPSDDIFGLQAALFDR
jgi:hypothetical protein